MIRWLSQNRANTSKRVTFGCSESNGLEGEPLASGLAVVRSLDNRRINGSGVVGKFSIAVLSFAQRFAIGICIKPAGSTGSLAENDGAFFNDIGPVAHPHTL